MNLSKLNLLGFSKKMLVCICAISLAGFSFVFKPVNAFANDGGQSSNGGQMHKCDPSVRSTIDVSKLTANTDYDGNLDETKYRDDKWDYYHYVYNSRLVIKDFKNGKDNYGKFFSIEFKNESGDMFFDGNDFHYYINVDAPDGTRLARFTISSSCYVDDKTFTRVIDKNYAKLSGCDWWRFDGGVDEKILEKIINNPEQYKDVKVYIDAVWIED